MIKRLKQIIIFLIFITSIASCRVDEPSYNGNFLYNFVTYEGVIDKADQFSYQLKDDSPLITLRTLETNGIEWKKGARALMNYEILNHKSGTQKIIKITDISKVIFDSLRVTTKENIINSPNAPVRLKSLWRTGNYINIDCSVQFTESKRQFKLVMDEATWQNEIVEVYLLQNLFDAETYFWRKAYASFFIGNVWNMPTCKTIRVHLNDESYPTKYYDFTK